jgi:hypothetical protein
VQSNLTMRIEVRACALIGPISCPSSIQLCCTISFLSHTILFNSSVSMILWHPAKTTTRKSRCFCALHHHDRMLMSSCHIAFEHRHHLAFACIKLFSEKPSFVF